MSTRTFYRIDSTRVSLREYWWGKGPPTLVKWLRDRGCADFRYDLTPGFAPGQDGDEDEL